MNEKVELADADQHLYFIHNKKFGMMKIGISSDVASRCRALSCACGVSLEVVGVLEAGARYESDLHHIFNDYRTLGEWFNVCDELFMLANSPLMIPAWIILQQRRIMEGRTGFASRPRPQKIEFPVSVQAARARRIAEREELRKIRIDGERSWWVSRERGMRAVQGMPAEVLICDILSDEFFDASRASNGTEAVLLSYLEKEAA